MNQIPMSGAALQQEAVFFFFSKYFDTRMLDTFYQSNEMLQNQMM